MTDDWRNETNQRAQGGTEQMMQRIYSAPSITPYLSDFQIIPSRVRELSPDKYRIYYLHDLPEDPESRHLASGGWRKFNRLVFVSHWQMNEYVRHFRIPYSRCAVIRNATHLFEDASPALGGAPASQVRMIYHTTPHRGLAILVPVFERLYEQFGDKIHLDVYSSFAMYGWEERDREFEQLFERIRAHDGMTYHGFQPNDVVREALARSHVFPYPSIWRETSCLALIEAMLAGVVCVHPNYAALAETSAGLTLQYQMQDDPDDHARVHYNVLEEVVRALLSDDDLKRESLGVGMARLYAQRVYDWNATRLEWVSLLQHIRDTEEPVGAGRPDEDKFVLDLGRR